MRKLTLTAAMAAIITAAAARAEDTIVFATTNAPQVPVNAEFLHPWVAAVNADGQGILTIETRDGAAIANHANVFDRVESDIVDMGFGLTIFADNRYPRTLVGTLPFLSDNNVDIASAMWTLYESGAFDEELGDLVPIMFTAIPQASVNVNGHEINALSDLSGLKIIATTPASAIVVQAMGGTPLSFNITEQYEALQRGTADGTIIAYTALPGFKLDEVTTNHFSAPLGGAIGAVFMNRESYDALTPEARDLLMRHGGREGTIAFSEFWAAQNAGIAAHLGSTDAHTFNDISPEELASFEADLAGKIHAGWADHVPGGADLLAALKAELAKVTN